MSRRFTGNHDDDPRFDRDDHMGMMVRCRCGQKFLDDPWSARRTRGTECDEDDASAEAKVEL